MDDYLEYCAQREKDPEKPYSGRFVVRVEPELHKQIAIEARKKGTSINSLVSDALSKRLEEISRGDPSAAQQRLALVQEIPGLIISDKAVDLARLLMTQGVVPKGSEEDALHISLAAAQGVDYLLTWNFKHINNAEMKSEVSRIVESCSFECPQICSPEELGGEC